MEKLLVGIAPDFVMKRGLVEVFHRGKVEVHRNGERPSEFPFHNRSLLALLNKMKTVFRPDESLFDKLTDQEDITRLEFSLTKESLNFELIFLRPEDLDASELPDIRQYIYDFLGKLIKKTD